MPRPLQTYLEQVASFRGAARTHWMAIRQYAHAIRNNIILLMMKLHFISVANWQQMVRPSHPFIQNSRNHSNVELCFAISIFAIKSLPENCAILFVERSNCQINYKSLHRTEQWTRTDSHRFKFFYFVYFSFRFSVTFAATHCVRLVWAPFVQHQMNELFSYIKNLHASLSFHKQKPHCRCKWNIRFGKNVFRRWGWTEGKKSIRIIEIEWNRNQHKLLQPSKVLTERNG